MTTSKRIAAAAMVLIVAAHATARGQQDVGLSLDLVAFGGFLGYLDGFVEYPAGPWDAVGPGPLASGGLVGVKRWLLEEKPVGAWLVTGNNMPRHRDFSNGPTGLGPTNSDHLFWRQLRTLSPTAVALATEDFIRALEADKTSGPLARLAAESTLPFLATNVFVRVHSKGLNSVTSGEFTLLVSSDQSLALTDRLLMECDDGCPKAMSATLEDAGPVAALAAPGGALAPSTITGAAIDSGKRLRFLLESSPLRPGRSYRLKLENGAEFAFQTSRALTPRTDGLPMISAVAGQARIAVVAFVDPDVRNVVPPEWWSWRRGSAGAPECRGERCEVHVESPLDTWKHLKPLIKGSPVPVPVVMTELGDELDAELLSSAPEMRVAIISPDALSLGRAADRAPGRYSGDLGYHALINTGVDSGVSQVRLRPEWIGETVHTLRTSVSSRDGAVRFDPPNVSVRFIAGAALRYRPSPRTGSRATAQTHGIEYFVVDGKDDSGAELIVGRAPRVYAPFIGGSSSFIDGTPQRNLWTVPADLQAFLLDLSRAGAHADIALVDDYAIDGGFVNWLAEAAAASGGEGIPWLSSFAIERALDRTSRTVKVDVAGKELTAFLAKALEFATNRGRSLCVSGIGVSCPLAAAKLGDVHVNARDVAAEQFYSVALPMEYALALAADESRHPVELETLILLGDARFPSRVDPVPTGCASNSLLGSKCRPRSEEARKAAPAVTAATVPPVAGESLKDLFETRWARRHRITLRLDPVEFEFKKIRVDQPEGSALKSLPEEGRDVKPQQAYAAKGAVDLGIDLVGGLVLHGLADVALGFQKLDDVESYPTDRWSVGSRLDWTVHRAGLQAVFAGLSLESKFHESRSTPEAALKKEKQNTPTGTIERIERVTLTSTGFPRLPRARNVSLGVRADPIGAPVRRVRLTDVAIGLVFVTRFDDIRELMLAGQTVTTDQLARLGEQGVADAAFTEREAELRADPSFNYLFGTTSSVRMDIGGTLSVKTVAKDGRLTLAGAYRHYFDAPGTDRLFTPRRVVEIRLAWTDSFLGRFTVAPYLNVFRLWTKGDDVRFTTVEGGIKLGFLHFRSWGPGHSRK